VCLPAGVGVYHQGCMLSGSESTLGNSSRKCHVLQPLLTRSANLVLTFGPKVNNLVHHLHIVVRVFLLYIHLVLSYGSQQPVKTSTSLLGCPTPTCPIHSS